MWLVILGNGQASCTLSIYVCYALSMDLCNFMGCPMQSNDRYFPQETMDLLPNYNIWIVHSVPYAKYGLSRWGFILFWGYCLFEVMQS